MIGQIVSHYRIIERLGEGGMGDTLIVLWYYQLEQQVIQRRNNRFQLVVRCSLLNRMAELFYLQVPTT